MTWLWLLGGHLLVTLALLAYRVRRARRPVPADERHPHPYASRGQVAWVHAHQGIVIALATVTGISLMHVPDPGDPNVFAAPALFTLLALIPLTLGGASMDIAVTTLRRRFARDAVIAVTLTVTAVAAVWLAAQWFGALVR